MTYDFLRYLNILIYLHMPHSQKKSGYSFTVFLQSNVTVSVKHVLIFSTYIKHAWN